VGTSVDASATQLFGGKTGGYHRCLAHRRAVPIYVDTRRRAPFLRDAVMPEGTIPSTRLLLHRYELPIFAHLSRRSTGDAYNVAKTTSPIARGELERVTVVHHFNPAIGGHLQAVAGHHRVRGLLDQHPDPHRQRNRVSRPAATLSAGFQPGRRTSKPEAGHRSHEEFGFRGFSETFPGHVSGRLFLEREHVTHGCGRRHLRHRHFGAHGCFQNIGSTRRPGRRDRHQI